MSNDLEHLLWRLRNNHTAKHLCGSAADAIEKLVDRLEMRSAYQADSTGKLVKITVPIGDMPDGIECRDETIRMQDRIIADLRARRSP